jgi:hypothetical protein
VRVAFRSKTIGREPVVSVLVLPLRDSGVTLAPLWWFSRKNRLAAASALDSGRRAAPLWGRDKEETGFERK